MLIRLKNVQKVYGNGLSQTMALENVSLDINEGEMAAVVGRSGSGKSTLLHILAGIILPTKGTYTFDGESVSSMKYDELLAFRRRKIGLILQNYALLEDDNVFNNVAIPLRIAHKQRQEDVETKVCTAIEQVGLLDKRNQNVRKLSGGQRQRVAIARALVHCPQLLLADEPTGALHRDDEKSIIELIKTIHQRGTTVIIVTHNEEISTICDRRIVIDDGRITNAI